MHRYIPHLAKNAGFKKIGESRTPSGTEIWQDKIRRVESFLQRIPGLDIPLVPFHLGIKPMHFFGILGSLMFFVGFVAVIIVGASKTVLHESRMPTAL